MFQLINLIHLRHFPCFSCKTFGKMIQNIIYSGDGIVNCNLSYHVLPSEPNLDFVKNYFANIKFNIGPDKAYCLGWIVFDFCFNW